MYVARLVAPFAVATVIAGAVPVLEHCPQAPALSTFSSFELALASASKQFDSGGGSSQPGEDDNEDGSHSGGGSGSRSVRSWAQTYTVGEPGTRRWPNRSSNSLR